MNPSCFLLGRSPKVISEIRITNMIVKLNTKLTVTAGNNFRLRNPVPCVNAINIKPYNPYIPHDLDDKENNSSRDFLFFNVVIRRIHEASIYLYPANKSGDSPLNPNLIMINELAHRNVTKKASAIYWICP